jgi:hypothetical protein
VLVDAAKFVLALVLAKVEEAVEISFRLFKFVLTSSHVLLNCSDIWSKFFSSVPV